jgi:hypothetical protein
LDVKSHKAVEVRDPYDGLALGDLQVESIYERRSVFDKRMIYTGRARLKNNKDSFGVKT